MDKLNKNNKLILLYITSSIVLEVCFFALLGMGIFPRYFWFDLSAIVVVVSFLYLSQNFVVESVLFWIAFMFQFILSLTNIIVKKAASELFSFDMLFLSAEGLQAFEKSFIDFTRSAVLLSLLAVVIYVYIKIAQSKNFRENIYSKNKFATVLLTFFILSTLGTCGYVGQKTLISDTKETNEYYVFESDKYLYRTLVSKVDAYQKFGTFGFYTKNILNLLNNKKPSDEIINDSVDYLLGGSQDKSDYFGISSGNNVISILLETMEYYAIDPYFTPTLYDLFYESQYSVKLKNFYANNRTNISEGLTLFGNYDKSNPINVANDNVLQVLSNDNVKFTLPAILKSNGYTTSYYHDYVSWYYNRNITHLKAGFDNIIGLESMDKLSKWVDYNEDGNNEFYRWKNWTLDSDVMSAYFSQMTNSEGGVFSGDSFYTHFSLITMHGNHDKKPQLQSYYDTLTYDIDTKGGHFDNMCEFLKTVGYTVPVENPDMFEHFLWYKSAAMDVDKMLNILITNLKNTYTDKYENERRLTLFDTTTLLLFADHNCYYNGLANTMRNIEFSNNVYNPNLYHIPCVIVDTKLASAYKNSTGSTNVEKFVSTYNLLPTMLDILGQNYNPLLYQGDHIFTSNINVFQSNISGAPYFTDKFLLTYSTIKYRANDATDDEEKEFKKGVLATFTRLKYITNIYDYPVVLDKYYQKLSK